MAGKDRRYIVDGTLNAQPIHVLLSKRAARTDVSGIWNESLFRDIDAELPVSPDGALEAGRLYDSSVNPGVKYYVPRYTLHAENGRFTTSLKLRGPNEDPDGPLGYLTVNLEPEIPQGAGFTLREMDHEALVQIDYQMLLEEGDTAETPPPAVEASGVDLFVGEWVNADEHTGGMTRLIIEAPSSGQATLHGFGKCHPDDCDWGTTPAQVMGQDLIGTYDFGFKRTHLRVSRSGEHLIAEVEDKYAPGDGRTDRQTTYTLRNSRPPVGDRPADRGEGTLLSIQVGALERGENNIRRCVLPILSLEEFDRIFQVMTAEEHQAALRIRCLATVGHRTWQQIFLHDSRFRGPGQLLQRNAIIMDALNVQEPERTVSPSTGGTTHEGRFFSGALAAKPIAGAPHAARFAPGTVAAKKTASVSVTNATRMQTVSPAKTQWFRASEFRIQDGPMVTCAWPKQTVVDTSGQPALLRIPVEATQTVQPFTFATNVHAYMFDVPQEPKTQVLVRREVREGGGVAGTFYQDSAFRDQFYYQPTQFRLSRASTSPYLPDLIAAFHDVVTEEGEMVSVQYRVELGFRAVPYVDPSLLDLARAQLAESPGKPLFFTALAPLGSKLVLLLTREDGAGGFNQTPVERTEAIVDFNIGIRDSVNLSQAEFEQIFASFQSPSGIGLEGYVEADVPGTRTSRVDVKLSLNQATGPVFDQDFNGPIPDKPGHYLVTLRNRIESPIRLTRVRVSEMPGGVQARPTMPTPNQDIRCGETIPIEYEVVPADAVVLNIEPVLESEVLTDHGVIWEKLFVNQGYTSDTFTVPIGIDTAFFGTPPTGMEPLTGVRVAFEADTTIDLTPTEPEREVTLRMPLLPRLLKAPDARRYTYRVTNLHAEGEGAYTDWLTHEGNLVVVPATGA